MTGITDVYNYLAGLGDMGNPQGTLQGQANGMIIPALATAAKQYSDSGQYAEAGERAATTANPFGDRSMYKNKLNQMYTDPNYIMSDPSYQWRLNQGMGNTNRMLNAQGYQGSGKSAIDLTNYAQNAASQEWEKEHNRLYEAAGGKFSPAEAAKYIMQGNELKLGAENNALASLFYPALMQGTGNTINNNVGGGTAGTSGVAGGNAAANGATKWVYDASTGAYKWFNAQGQLIGTTTQAPSIDGDMVNGAIPGGVSGNQPIDNDGIAINPGIDPTSPYNQNDTSPYYPPNSNDDTSNYIPPDIQDQYWWDDYGDNGGG